MKRVTVLLVAVCLLCQPDPVAAADQDKDPYEITVQGVYPVEKGDQAGVKVRAKLRPVTEKDRVKGEWTITGEIDGKTVSRQGKGSAEEVFFTDPQVVDPLRKDQPITVTATFHGRINGEKLRLSRTRTLTPPAVDVRLECHEDQVKVYGQLTGTEKASARWLFEVRRKGEDQPFDRYQSDEMRGLSHHQTLNRPKGPFEVRVHVDGRGKGEQVGDLFGEKGGRFASATGEVSSEKGCSEQGDAPVSSTRALRIEADHQILTSRKIEKKWIEIPGTEVDGVRMRAKLDTDGDVRGIWRYHYAYPKVLKLPGGKEKKVMKRGILAARNGVVDLHMKRKDQYRVIVDFQGTVNGKKVHVKQPYTFDIPRMMQAADKKGEGAPTVIRAEMTGQTVNGHWMMAVARRDGKILYLHEGDPRFEVSLPKGEYILKTVFYGEVDGQRLAMQESKTLKVKKSESDSYLIPGKNNEYRTYQQGVSAVQGMKKSARLAESKNTYSLKTEAYSGGTAATLVIIGLIIYRRKKMS